MRPWRPHPAPALGQHAARAGGVGAWRWEGEGALSGGSRGASLLAYVRRESRAAGWGLELGRAEAAPPSGIRAGSLPERRVPAEVCVYLTAWVEGAGLRLLAAEADIGPPAAKRLAGRSSRAAAAAATPGDVTASGEGRTRGPNAAHVRGPGPGLSPGAARCVGDRGRARSRRLCRCPPLGRDWRGDAGPPGPILTRGVGVRQRKGSRRG